MLRQWQNLRVKMKMGWQLYSLTFQLSSPLHVGFHKVMHLFRTRAYLPAKPFWGALTAKLTPQLQLTDYEKVGSFLRIVMRFGYFYLSDGSEIFLPQYTEEGLKYGSLSQIVFEKRFISSMASTPIESFSLTAEEGMLHEVEFVNPYTIDDGKPVFLKGLLWVSEFSEEGLSVELKDDSFSVKYKDIEVKFTELLDILQVGGERKYGFGKLKLKKIENVNEKNLRYLGFPGKWKQNGNEINLEFKKGESIWSHAKHTPDLRIKGNIEPIVSRDWSNKGAGKELKLHGLYWSPGSILTEDKSFKISKDFGLWE